MPYYFAGSYTHKDRYYFSVEITDYHMSVRSFDSAGNPQEKWFQYAVKHFPKKLNIVSNKVFYKADLKQALNSRGNFFLYFAVDEW